MNTTQADESARTQICGPGEGVLSGPPLSTRRQFAAAAAATALAALHAERARADEDQASEDDAQEDAAAEDDEEPSAEQQLTTVDDAGNVHIINTFEDVIDKTTFTPVASWTIPVGCNVYADCPGRAATVQSNPGARPFTQVGCLDLQTGDYQIVLPEPVTAAGYAPSEARCTDVLLVWVEVNNADDSWVFYASPFNGQVVGEGTPGLVKLGEGDGEWLPPQFAVAGNTVVWQVMPDPSGSHSTENSHAYRWRLGNEAGKEVWSSPGRFACAPNISAGVLTIAPRVNASEGVYYGITALDLDDDARQLDQLVMPAAVKPFFATRIGDAFAFSVEANYGYSSLLSNMGYYIGPGEGPFEYVAREPSAPISYVGGYHIVKSNLMYFVIDLEKQTYARIGSANGCVDYGDYPATAGSVGQFVTYAAVKDASTGIPNGVLVRIFSLS